MNDTVPTFIVEDWNLKYSSSLGLNFEVAAEIQRVIIMNTQLVYNINLKELVNTNVN